MATYFINDDATGTYDGTTWGKAFLSFKDAQTAGVFGSANTIYVGNDHVCPASHSATLTLTGPTSGAPCVIISSTVSGDTTVSYTKSATNQIDTSEVGTYDITFDGAFALYGIQMLSGRHINITADGDEEAETHDCTFKLGHAGTLTTGYTWNFDATIDCDADTGNTSTSITHVYRGIGLTFANISTRTGYIHAADTNLRISGADYSGFTHAFTGITGTATPFHHFDHCLTPASYTMFYNTGMDRGYTIEQWAANMGAADSPQMFIHRDHWGRVTSAPGDSAFGPTAEIYRAGGATIEGANTAWLCVTNNTATEHSPYRTPWIYGTVSSTGSTNFDLYFVHDTVSPINTTTIDNSQIWLEVQFLKTSDEAQGALATGHRVITATATAHATDTSDWNGTGPSFTNKRKLRTTATVGEAGMYRARVAVAVASITSSAYLYLDPKVTVSAA